MRGVAPRLSNSRESKHLRAGQDQGYNLTVPRLAIALILAAYLCGAAAEDVITLPTRGSVTQSYLLAIPETGVAETLKWVKPNETVDLLFIDNEPSDIQLSASVELEVTHTEPGVKGDTASGGGNKPATLETGATVNVPLFVNIGDKIKVDTRSGSYMSRA